MRIHAYLKLMVVFVAIAEGTSRTKTNQNFVFFQPDEMRAESLGCYGHPISKTPHFDAFAGSPGTVRFEQPHVSYTVCSQSRASFMTGWHTHVAGHRSLWALLHEWEPNLLKYFKSSGYNVMWWGKNDLLAADAWESSVTSAMSIMGRNYGSNPYNLTQPEYYYSFLREATDVGVNDTTDARNVFAAIDFLKSGNATDRPFVIFLPLSLPHPPYSCPEPFYSMYDPDDLPPLRDWRDGEENGKPDYHQLIRGHHYFDTMDPDELDALLRKIHAVYLGAIAYSDYLFGLLMSALKESGLSASTNVAMWSDHGDYAGDYGLVEKWPSGLEDVLTRVPLLIRAPQSAMAAEDRGGHVVTSPVQLFDIVPTFLELAGIDEEHVHYGRSLVPQLNGAEGEAGRFVFAEGGYGTHEPRDLEGRCDEGFVGTACALPGMAYWPKSTQQQEEPLSVCRAVMVRNETHKLVLRGDPQDEDHHSELYDLTRDPRETENLYGHPDYAGAVTELKLRLLNMYLLESDVTPWEQSFRIGLPGWVGNEEEGVNHRGGPADMHEKDFVYYSEDYF